MTLSLPRDSIEDMIEPFLLAQGFIERTPRGRLVTIRAFHHLGLMVPADDRNAQESDCCTSISAIVGAPGEGIVPASATH